jgi:alpha,alpha-trehalose phosphorylase
VIRLWVEGEPFSLLSGEVKSYTRTLQLREGLLERTLVWRSPKGHEVQINVTRLVSFEHKHLMAIRYEVTPLNFSGSILLEAALDGDVTNLVAENDPRAGSGLQGRVLHVEAHQSENGTAMLLQRTENTQFQLAVTMDTVLTTANPYSLESIDEDLTVSAVYNVTAQQGQLIRLEKYVGYVTSRDPIVTDLVEYAWEVVRKGKQSGFDALRQSQHDFMTRFWDRADVEIKGDPALQQGIRFNLYHLLQSVGRDGRTNIAAKGLTGEGYEGHYFWDTETYVLPFFLFNSPAISRSLLEYRYGILDKARERARQMAHNKGALFPWRTINGEECSAYFPAGTAQYHIDADIALAIKRYVQATNDDLFLVEAGAEILFETARRRDRTR